MTKEEIAERFRQLQDEICNGLEKLDGKAVFHEDSWQRSEGGGGRTRVIKDGGLLEKGGVAFSAVHGDVTPEMKKQLNLEGNEFFATGVSIVLHPGNPHVPVIHMNVRYFELDDGTYWFGGGIDLTPHYIVPVQARMFHQSLKNICDKYGPELYAKYQPWANEYFYIPHRGETRGIGGIFYDHQSAGNTVLAKEALFELAIDLGSSFVDIYAAQAALGRDLPFTEEEVRWRNLRRGRYVEFNLVNDRGTKFGLHSGGRTESILMSLPARAEWEYDFHPVPGSAEEKTLNYLQSSHNWLED